MSSPSYPRPERVAAKTKKQMKDEALEGVLDPDLNALKGGVDNTVLLLIQLLRRGDSK